MKNFFSLKTKFLARSTRNAEVSEESILSSDSDKSDFVFESEKAKKWPVEMENGTKRKNWFEGNSFHLQSSAWSITNLGTYWLFMS